MDLSLTLISETLFLYTIANKCLSPNKLCNHWRKIDYKMLSTTNTFSKESQNSLVKELEKSCP